MTVHHPPSTVHAAPAKFIASARPCRDVARVRTATRSRASPSHHRAQLLPQPATGFPGGAGRLHQRAPPSQHGAHASGKIHRLCTLVQGAAPRRRAVARVRTARAQSCTTFAPACATLAATRNRLSRRCKTAASTCSTLAPRCTSLPQNSSPLHARAGRCTATHCRCTSVHSPRAVAHRLRTSVRDARRSP
jgi:hypothetical protein